MTEALSADIRWTDQYEDAPAVLMADLHRLVRDLGYDPNEVLSVAIDADHIQVMTVVHGQIGHRIVHRHPVVHV